MSVIMDYRVRCDSCGAADFASATRRQTRAEAKRCGWRREQGKDLCPNCKTIADHMRDTLLEKGLPTVMWGDAGSMDDCARRAGLMDDTVHPMDRWQTVLNGLDHSPLFEKFYVRIDTFKHNKNRKVRAFKLKEM